MTFLDMWKAFRKPSNKNKLKSLTEDIEIEREERKIQIEMQKLQLNQLKNIQARKTFSETKQQILEPEIMYDDDDDDDDDDELTDLLRRFSPILGQLTNNSTSNQGQPSLVARDTPQFKGHITDDEIRAYLDTVDKKHLKIAKVAPKELVKRKIHESLPMTDEETNRAIHILETEY